MSMTMRDNGGGEYDLPPEGTYLAICYLLADLGMQPRRQGTPQAKLVAAWELPHALMKDGRPYSVREIYTASLNEKAHLRKALESWRGRRFTEEECKGFQLRNVLGQACQLTIVHSQDGKYANVSSVAGLIKGTPVPRTANELLFYDLDAPDPAVFSRLPEWIQKKIQERIREQPQQHAPQYAPQQHAQAPQYAQQPPQQYSEANPPPVGHTAPPTNGQPAFVDDDIPF